MGVAPKGESSLGGLFIGDNGEIDNKIILQTETFKIKFIYML